MWLVKTPRFKLGISEMQVVSVKIEVVTLVTMKISVFSYVYDMSQNALEIVKCSCLSSLYPKSVPFLGAFRIHAKGVCSLRYVR
jgi:hypothetical protein